MFCLGEVDAFLAWAVKVEAMRTSLLVAVSSYCNKHGVISLDHLRLVLPEKMVQELQGWLYQQFLARCHEEDNDLDRLAVLTGFVPVRFSEDRSECECEFVRVFCRR